MGWFDGLRGRIGRRRLEPARDTAIYPRLMQIGTGVHTRDRPMIKPTPANLRRLGKTTYSRRAIKIVKDSIANLQWEVIEKPGVTQNPETQRQREVVTACLAEPNGDDSFRSFLEQIVEDLLICGAGAYEHQLGGDQQRPLWMWPVDALSIQISPLWSIDKDKPRYYQALGYGNIGGTMGRPLRNEELTYIRLDPTTENPFGLGPLEVAFASISRLLGAQDYAGNVSGNAQPENLLFFEGADPTAVDTIRAFWRNDVEGQGGTPIFGGDGKITGIKLRGATDDALYLKYQELLVREIATAFGLSPQNFGIERDVNRDTAETAEDRDWDLTIRPTANLIASYLNREQISGRLGFSQIQFRFVGLDREDEVSTSQIFERRYRNNAVTPNEERARLGQPPMDSPWGDLTFADTQIALKAAQGAAVVEDDQLPGPKPPSGQSRKKGC